MKVRVRNARASDAAAIARIHVETWRDTYAALLPADYLTGELSVERNALHWTRALRRTDGRERTLVAETPDGAVVAYAAFGRSRERLYPNDGELYAIYVSLDAQDLGIGRRLCGVTAERLLSAGRQAMSVEVLAGNPSRYFYENLGAQLVATKTHVFAGQALPALIYRWPELTVLMAKSGRPEPSSTADRAGRLIPPERPRDR